MSQEGGTSSSLPWVAGALAAAGAVVGAASLWHREQNAIAARDDALAAAARALDAKLAAEKALAAALSGRPTGSDAQTAAGPPRKPRPAAALSGPAPSPLPSPPPDGSWSMQVRAIGRATSCFRISRDTPRQGGLAPATRARIHLDPWVANSSLSGLQAYSHAMVFYAFDTNTNTAARKRALASRGRAMNGSVKPPALGGAKVGVLATRTPHRPNHVGATIVRILMVSDGVNVFRAASPDAPAAHASTAGGDADQAGAAAAAAASARPRGAAVHGGRVAAQRPAGEAIGKPGKAGLPSGGWVLVSGVDFTQGTPVLDIKPFVAAYDAPPGAVYPSWVARPSAVSVTPSESGETAAVIPRTVWWSAAASEGLQRVCADKRACKLYRRDEASELMTAVSQVLGADVRSAFQRGGRVAANAAADSAADDVELSVWVDGASLTYRRLLTTRRALAAARSRQGAAAPFTAADAALSLEEAAVVAELAGAAAGGAGAGASATEADAAQGDPAVMAALGLSSEGSPDDPAVVVLVTGAMVDRRRRPIGALPVAEGKAVARSGAVGSSEEASKEPAADEAAESSAAAAAAESSAAAAAAESSAAAAAAESSAAAAAAGAAGQATVAGPGTPADARAALGAGGSAVEEDDDVEAAREAWMAAHAESPQEVPPAAAQSRDGSAQASSASSWELLSAGMAGSAPSPPGDKS
ncbi:hypothetical protein FNF29_05276 [Cafeteria roenbergensis]|uniref:TsaA-like domain-containing protein n=1 Tax=Cafeteria roenbergensis TaxID=33653 RepID=A0A5A8CBI5_CAFRO|nr:hypothetical protein FNF29_05276 [Cafeteria roenbergensis]|eukprot:KAA0150473.1 hypothetical protein FNF29_05276 [Cafeteria roenbergensis]